VIQGQVTAVNGTTGAGADVSLVALQTISVSGSSLQIATPLLNTSTDQSTPTVAIQSNAACQGTTPTGAFCAQYTLVVPASNPSVGSFVSGTATTFAPPASGDVIYSVQAQTSLPMSGGSPFCSPSILQTNMNISGQPLQVTASAVSTAKNLDFSGCM
jgi:hypothetical protein